MPDLEPWKAYVRQIADLMQLRDWEFRLPDERPTGDTAMASVVCWQGRRNATIRFAQSFFDEEPAEQRYVVVHELIHCRQAHADDIVERDFSPAKYSEWLKTMEYGVDALARALAPHLPLPSHVEAKP